MSKENLKSKMRELFPYFLWLFIIIACGILFFFYIQKAKFRGLQGIFSVMRPIVFGLVITFFVAPAVSRLEAALISLQTRIRTSTKKHLPVPKKWRTSTKPRTGLIRFFAMFACYVIILGLLVLTFVYVIPQLINSLSAIVTLATDAVTDLIGRVDKLADRWDHLPLANYINSEEVVNVLNGQLGNLTNAIQKFLSNLVPQIYSIFMKLANSIVNLIIGLIVSVYLIADRERMLSGVKRILYAMFKKDHAMLILNVGSETANIFKFFFLGKIIDSLIIGILCYILMLILRLDYPLLIATLVGVTNIIPYFGPFFGAVPSALILFLSSPMQAFIFVIMILILQQFDGNILGPYILGGTLGIKPFWIIFAVTVGGRVMGVPGMLFGVPFFTVLYTLVKRYIDYRLEKKHLGRGDLAQLEKDREAFSHPVFSGMTRTGPQHELPAFLKKLGALFKKKEK